MLRAPNQISMEYQRPGTVQGPAIDPDERMAAIKRLDAARKEARRQEGLESWVRQNAVPRETPEQHEARLLRGAQQVYGPTEVRRSRNRGEAMVFPAVSTMPGYPRTFMQSPTGQPAGFQGPPGRQTYTTPATATPMPEVVGSPEWTNSMIDYLVPLYDQRRLAGEKLPPLPDYLSESIRQHVEGYAPKKPLK